MTRAVRKRAAEPTWYLMRSLNSDANWWLAPIINHVRILASAYEFDLYLHRVPVNKDGKVELSTKA